MKVCDKTCIFFFIPIINKYEYFLTATRSLLSRCPSYVPYWARLPHYSRAGVHLGEEKLEQEIGKDTNAVISQPK